MKLKFILFLFFVSSLFLSAQSNINYGLKIGVVSSKAADSGKRGYLNELYKDSRLSGSYSIFVQFLNYKNFRLEVESCYKQEGGEDNIPITTAENPDGSGEFITVDHAFDLLAFELSLQPKIENDDICIFAILSPTLNFLLKNRDQVVRNKDVNDFVLGYNIGIGLQPKSILSGKLFVELKYGSSFSNLIESDYLEVKFNKLQFNIGCYIN